MQTIYFDASFIKICREIRKLQRFEYIKNSRHGCRHILGFMTSYSPNKIYKNLIIMGFQVYFETSLTTQNIKLSISSLILDRF